MDECIYFIMRVKSELSRVLGRVRVTKAILGIVGFIVFE